VEFFEIENTFSSVVFSIYIIENTFTGVCKVDDKIDLYVISNIYYD